MANRYVKNQSSHPCGQQVTPQRHNRIPLRPQIQQLPSGPRRTHPLPQTPHLKTNQPHQPNNTNTANTTRYAVAELHPNNTETPYPSLSFNNPPGGAINYTTTPPTSANY